MTKTKDKVLVIRITEDLKNKLDSITERNRSSTSEYVRNLIIKSIKYL